MSGELMASEVAEAPGTFARTAAADLTPALAPLGLTDGNFGGRSAFYTIARGSSDAAATIISYEFMRETGLPMTSLPPSIFSLGAGVKMDGAIALGISQSGASEDLVRSIKGAKAAGAVTVGIVNVEASPVGTAVDALSPIGAGPELAVPATKSVVGSVAAAMALLAALKPAYAPAAKSAAATFAAIGTPAHARAAELQAALAGANHVYVVGRGCGFGAAQEVALKLKETCVLHAEAYSASEVLHGPLQLVKRGLTVLILDTGEESAKASLDAAEARFNATGGKVFRIAASDITADALVPAAAAALLLCVVYPIIREIALSLGMNPDAPETLSKVTQTI
ncbi:SIS domain-containing protein [Ketogulonicigenium vulgare]|uniref:Glucosamine--fructose-6-phosphate aminotransferase, isomerizing n=1 Tax=Ketogulonicigenium vulgare (strain WSH-001) TaxID=759362 RepID=F9YA82_KETVW|nr:SIS domain-containing protein [Ketogulonicigenium vulgare]ADO42036.1 probable aminotransferase [Ketogulonicigenium vulgare Y25]AEM40255.1 Glucosamine--fructose-6-phosphate aminotransferase, isomerizing [Ketogulonicigenium vulgare WSH-001]ALJ80456.1 glucosamine-fructose-6-phosphate aminotransferase [Ketogulonicigenium vulgare]ANW33283.1 glucosamine-fructose-6-phosphate aminotransferase [Ketogulonicigenium vulgare]AOZ53962.1 aminotransferase [Ketogulonicigenium vulgare]